MSIRWLSVCCSGTGFRYSGFKNFSTIWLPFSWSSCFISSRTFGFGFRGGLYTQVFFFHDAIFFTSFHLWILCATGITASLSSAGEKSKNCDNSKLIFKNENPSNRHCFRRLTPSFCCALIFRMPTWSKSYDPIGRSPANIGWSNFGTGFLYLQTSV